MEIVPIKSSSRGNATVIMGGDVNILVDCGISGKLLEGELLNRGISPESLTAIAVSHEHIDHIKGVGIISRKYNLPIFANLPTWRAMGAQLGKIAEENVKVFETDKAFYIKDIKVLPFKTSHDAAQSVGFTFTRNDKKVALATDMGVMTEEILSCLRGSRCVLLEANYDRLMLDAGPYPYQLKQRIKGERGHLCNDDCACAARCLAQSGVKEIILGHLSEENNFPKIALETVKQAICGFDTAVSLA